MEAKTIISMLRKRYEAKEWLAASEVPDRTGFDRTRRCDFLSMGLIPSKGVGLMGFEVKVSRSDWLSELQDPSKAELFAHQCQSWWVVAPKGVIKTEELPNNWGYMEANKSLRVKIPATVNREAKPSIELIASLALRCKTEADFEGEIIQAERRIRQEIQNERRKDALDFQSKVNEAVEKFQMKVDDFEARSGINIDTYQAGEIADTIKLARLIHYSGTAVESFNDKLEPAIKAVEALKGLAPLLSMFDREADDTQN